jgi:hypothetical protein
MDRSFGWVELVGLPCRRHPSAADKSRVARVRRLVDEATGPGWTAWVGEADGRRHVWITAAPGASSAGMLPFFKALGSVVPQACGVLDLPGPTRWVMTRGCVDKARDPDRTPVA